MHKSAFRGLQIAYTATGKRRMEAKTILNFAIRDLAKVDSRPTGNMNIAVNKTTKIIIINRTSRLILSFE
jgi:hypothetical protein